MNLIYINIISLSSCLIIHILSYIAIETKQEASELIEELRPAFEKFKNDHDGEKWPLESKG